MRGNDDENDFGGLRARRRFGAVLSDGAAAVRLLPGAGMRLDSQEIDQVFGQLLQRNRGLVGEEQWRAYGAFDQGTVGEYEYTLLLR